jgi:tetratricopeptide (TPR) repeat protein
VKTATFVRRNGAGEHLGETMLRAALGDTLRVCDPGADPFCCGAMPCRRAAEFDLAGYALQLRRVTAGADPAKVATPVLVGLREPTLHALAAYGHDLAGRRHSVELLQSWLSAEAAAAVDFAHRWQSHAVLRHEKLIAEPRAAFETMSAALGLDLDDAALDRAVATADACEDRTTQVSPKALDAELHFVRSLFVEFANLLAEEADYLGYPLWTERKPTSGPVTTLYRARRARAESDFEAVLAILGPFVAVNPVEPDIRALFGEALLETGREVEGRRALEAALQAQPDFFEGHAILARHAYRLGLLSEARGILREAMARRGGAKWVRGFLSGAKFDAELLREFPGETEPAVSREAVVAGFTWILGRKPESDAVIEAHRRLHDDDDLRISLLRSQEFREFHGRLAAGEKPYTGACASVGRDEMLHATRWLLGRPLRSREEAGELLDASSPAALRIKLIDTDEFRGVLGEVVEGA